MRVFHEIFPGTFFEFSSIKSCLLFLLGQIVGGLAVLAVLYWYFSSY